MDDDPKRDISHEILSDMAEQDVEQPGDTPSDLQPNVVPPEKEQTEDAPRQSN